ncbi:MAG: hypothetical protein QM723_37685 [Myxococcaceae bacterium]
MSDFNDWQKLWSEKKAPLPDIAKVARRQHRGLLIANLTFWPVTAIELTVAAIALSHYDEPQSVTLGLFMLVVVSILSTFFFRMQKGLWREATETPQETLARLERHERSMRRAAWAGALTFLGVSLFVVIDAWLNTATEAERFMAGPLGLLAAAIATVVLWPRFIGRHADRLREQINRFKRELEA